MATRRRPQRLSSQIREELSLILLREVRDPGIGFITVTDVELTADLRLAKVYVSVMGSEEERARALSGLERAGGFIRHKLGERLTVRFIPELSFRLDQSLDYGERIDRLLEQIKPKPESD